MKFDMQVSELTDVNTGSSRWMSLLHVVVFAAAILAASVSDSILWLKILVILALFPVYLVVANRLAALHPPGSLRLFGDGLGWMGPIWDVWTHKYNLIGLLSYYQVTGNKAALEASKRAADMMSS